MKKCDSSRTYALIMLIVLVILILQLIYIYFDIKDGDQAFITINYLTKKSVIFLPKTP